jgi:hypothetical protein
VSKELAKHLARELFALGDEGDEQCRRIQFKLGEWPDNERNGGGMNEDAMVTFFQRRIAKFYASKKKLV